MQKKVYLGLGSNLGERSSNLAQAIAELDQNPEIEIKAGSSVYETPPWGNENQPLFLNQVVVAFTKLNPRELLYAVKEIEIKMGRQVSEKWGPRIIDIDILLYGDDVVADDDLIIPHQLLKERLFVLVPLYEIEPDLVFPDDGTAIREVLDRVSLRVRSKIKKI